MAGHASGRVERWIGRGVSPVRYDDAVSADARVGCGIEIAAPEIVFTDRGIRAAIAHATRVGSMAGRAAMTVDVMWTKDVALKLLCRGDTDCEQRYEHYEKHFL